MFTGTQGPMETMRARDASFLHVEDAVSQMHIGSVGIHEGRQGDPRRPRRDGQRRVPGRHDDPTRTARRRGAPAPVRR